MNEGEKMERERKKNEKKQLKTIWRMIGRDKFDLAKALAETPCPISYLQYFQDSPLAILEMNRINSFTEKVLAAMFGDPSPNTRSGGVGQNLTEAYARSQPQLGEGGSFMATATYVTSTTRTPHASQPAYALMPVPKWTW